MCAEPRCRGFSLVEIVVFIALLGLALAGFVTLYSALVRTSVDVLAQKQAVAIATALLEEVQLRPFTFCDPNDAAVTTAASPAGCTTAEAIGPEAGETRYSEPRFDNVNDYHGFGMPSGGGIRDVTNTVVPGLNGYGANVTVAAISGAELPDVPASEGLRVTVTVTAPNGVVVTLQGYRLRYAPNTP